MHRDLKCSNLLLDVSGRVTWPTKRSCRDAVSGDSGCAKVKISDFGCSLAALVQESLDIPGCSSHLSKLQLLRDSIFYVFFMYLLQYFTHISRCEIQASAATKICFSTFFVTPWASLRRQHSKWYLDRIQSTNMLFLFLGLCSNPKSTMLSISTTGKTGNPMGVSGQLWTKWSKVHVYRIRCSHVSAAARSLCGCASCFAYLCLQ